MEDEVHRKSISFDEQSLQQLSVRSRTNSLRRRHLRCLIGRLIKFSRVRHQREVGPLSRSVMLSITDATDIHSITEWHSLFLSSVARITVDPPYGFTSPCGERYGFTLFR
jgi:hypothetical protein